jgi:hypothetical protein
MITLSISSAAMAALFASVNGLGMALDMAEQRPIQLERQTVRAVVIAALIGMGLACRSSPRDAFKVTGFDQGMALIARGPAHDHVP